MKPIAKKNVANKQKPFVIPKKPQQSADDELTSEFTSLRLPDWDGTMRAILINRQSNGHVAFGVPEYGSGTAIIGALVAMLHKMRGVKSAELFALGCGRKEIKLPIGMRR